MRGMWAMWMIAAIGCEQSFDVGRSPDAAASDARSVDASSDGCATPPPGCVGAGCVAIARRETIDEVGLEEVENAIAIDAAGAIHVVYYDDAGTRLKYATRDATGAWSTTVVDDSGSVGSELSLALDANGIHASYLGQPQGTLHYAHRALVGGTWTTEELATPWDAIRETAIAVEPSGVVHIIYHEQQGELGYNYTRIAHGPGVWDFEELFNSRGSWPAITLTPTSIQATYYDEDVFSFELTERTKTGWAIDRLEESTESGAESSIARGAAGLHIAYRDLENDDLKYGYRADDETFAGMTIDSEGSVGASPSLAVDAQEAVHIVYYDATNGDLRYAYRSPSGVWSTMTVLAEGDVGRHVSLALDATGTPHVVTYDVTQHRLDALTLRACP